MIVRGIDVSHYQSVNYARAAASIGFAIVKAGEGQHSAAVDLGPQTRGFRAAGVLVGSYHIGHPEQGHTPASEAAQYVRELRSVGWTAGRDLPPVLDIEPGSVPPKAPAMSKATITSWAKAFCAEVDRLLGIDGGPPLTRTGIYVGDSIASKIDIAAACAGRWFWRGGYGSAWPTSIPANCEMYQRVQTPPAVPGVSGSSLDIDVADDSTLRQMAPAFFPEPQPIPEDIMPTPNEIADAVLKRDGIIRIASGPEPSTVDNTWSLSTHITNLRAQNVNVLAQLGAMKGSLDAITAALAALASGGGQLDVQALIVAVRQASEDGAKAALAEGVVDVDVTVHDKTGGAA